MTEELPVKKITVATILMGMATLLTSTKLWMTLIGISVLYGLYWHSGYHFIQTSKSMPVELATVLLPILAEMYQTAMWGIVTAVGGYLGFTTLDKFTRGTSSATQAVTSMIQEHRTSKEEVIYREELERGD